MLRPNARCRQGLCRCASGSGSQWDRWWAGGKVTQITIVRPIISNKTEFNVLKLPVGKGFGTLWATSLRGSMHFREKIYWSPEGTESLNAGGWFALYFNINETSVSRFFPKTLLKHFRAFPEIPIWLIPQLLFISRLQLLPPAASFSGSHTPSHEGWQRSGVALGVGSRTPTDSIVERWRGSNGPRVKNLGSHQFCL